MATSERWPSLHARLVEGRARVAEMREQIAEAIRRYEEG